ncbi:MAG: hypothetical protein RI907_2811 [Pseudomonadota bacterium]|jgi:DNA-binding Lrp family transcriptional regulator
MKDDATPLDDTDLRLLRQLQSDASLSNQQLAEAVGVSPATCHRRVKALLEGGYIEKQVALLSPAKVADALGWGLHALVEVSLDTQAHEWLDAFERQACAHPAVQQCWRVSPGPDFVLVIHVPDMPAYQAVTAELFNQASQVRQVRAFFAVKRAKFGAGLNLG